jgi:hypothetical protein
MVRELMAAALLGQTHPNERFERSPPRDTLVAMIRFV